MTPSENTVTEKLAVYQKLVQTHLELCYNTAVPNSRMHRAVAYSVLGGGKRLRGSLLLHTAELFAGCTEPFLPLSSAVESIHAYSLIHDDLPCMDNDNLRHGKPSCHIEFDYATALLAGDALLTNAFQLMAGTSLEPAIAVRAIELLSSAAGIGGMVYGQAMDCSGTCGTWQELERMYSLKTGGLISASLGLGALAGGADKNSVNALLDFGMELGICYQIVDDILDILSTPEILGKPIGSDNKNSKLTCVSLLGIDDAKRLADCKTKNALTILDTVNADTAFLKSITELLLTRYN